MSANGDPSGMHEECQNNISLETVDILDVDELCIEDEDSWLMQSPAATSLDTDKWVREGFSSAEKSPNRSLLQHLDHVVRSGKLKSTYSSPLWSQCTQSLAACIKSDSSIDTRTFTRPKRPTSSASVFRHSADAAAHNSCSAESSGIDNPTAHVENVDGKSPNHPRRRSEENLNNSQPEEENWTEVNQRTFTKSSPRVRKSLFALGSHPLFADGGADAAALNGDCPTTENDNAAQIRCNGGEVGGWSDETGGKYLVERMSTDRHRLSDVSDVHQLARAQEARLRQLCSTSQPNILNHHGRNGQQRSWPNLSNGNLNVASGGGGIHRSPVSMSLDSPSDSEDGSGRGGTVSPPNRLPSSRSGLRRPSPRSSFSSPEAQLHSGSPSPTKKAATQVAPAVRSGIPRPNSTSKLPIHRKNAQNTNVDMRRNYSSAFRPVDSSWREGCF